MADYLVAIYVCRRAPDEIAGGWNEYEPEFHVCDGYKEAEAI